MKQKLLITLIIFSICLSMAAKDTKTNVKLDATSDTAVLEQKASYIIGHDLGNRLVSQGFDVSFEEFFAGIKDGASKKENRYSQEEVAAIMQEFQAYMQEKQQKAADLKKQAGVDYLANNKKQKGIITTDSGLQYKVLVKGSGEKPALTDKVKTHYKGMLIDGTEFDSSIKRGQPAEFPVNAVIPGWTEALQLMSVGAKWQLFIPSELAYGPRGAGDVIPPHSVLVFELELIEIVKDTPAEEKK